MACGTRAGQWLLLRLLLMATAALVLALAQPAALQQHPPPPRLARRSVTAADLGNFRGAMLVKNGKITTCECALIDNQAAFVAASCLDYGNGRNLDMSATYAIYFDGGMGQQPAMAPVNPADIIVHPRYGRDTNANNLAILQYSFTAQGSWVNYIAAYRDEWSDIVYVRRQLMSATQMQWATPAVRTNDDDDPGCTSASELYNRNQGAFFCSRIYTPSVFSTTCNMPYGSIYGVASSSMGIAALYSHSVVYGDSMCGGSQTYHYYTVLTNYLRYARSVLGRGPKEFVEDTEGLSGVRRIVNYYMGSSTAPNDDGTTMFTGDMVRVEGGGGGDSGQQQQQSPPPPPPQNSQSGTGPTQTQGPGSGGTSGGSSLMPSGNGGGNNSNNNNSNSNSNNNNNSNGNGNGNNNGGSGSNNNLTATGNPTATGSSGPGIGNPAKSDNSYDDPNANDALTRTSVDGKPKSSVDFGIDGMDARFSGLSRDAVIALSVAIPVSVVLLAILVFVTYRNYRRRHPGTRRWRRGSVKRKSVARSLVEQIGGAAREERLPAYEDLHDTSSIHTVPAVHFQDETASHFDLPTPLQTPRP
ncbi:hypothetical protein H4R18_003085 [Coemansia javaensis]|uniref:Peptidase S1 domain-containing protein n=1 Tax=Coemansia javaensis TaxID=2761396 RepID=A0A9W8H804_9FUNG|nr:hypothetical protein H4R18_003085 [Coemansia javaensis]